MKTKFVCVSLLIFFGLLTPFIPMPWKYITFGIEILCVFLYVVLCIKENLTLKKNINNLIKRK